MTSANELGDAVAYLRFKSNRELAGLFAAGTFPYPLVAKLYGHLPQMNSQPISDIQAILTDAVGSEGYIRQRLGAEHDKLLRMVDLIIDLGGE